MDLPYYFDTKYGCEIDNLLLTYNYLCIRTFDEHYRGGVRIWSDKIFIPDLTKTNDRNRIVDFMNILRKMVSFDIIEFDVNDIVRSGLVKEYIVAKLQSGM